MTKENKSMIGSQVRCVFNGANRAYVEEDVGAESFDLLSGVEDVDKILQVRLRVPTQGCVGISINGDPADPADGLDWAFGDGWYCVAMNFETMTLKCTSGGTITIQAEIFTSD